MPEPLPIQFGGFKQVAAATADLTGLTWYPGDLAIVRADKYSPTSPTLPAGWTTLSTISQTACCSSRVGWRILQAGDVDVGTWTGANSLTIVLYRNTDQVAPFVLGGGGFNVNLEFRIREITPITYEPGFIIYSGFASADTINDLPIVGGVNRSAAGFANTIFGDTAEQNTTSWPQQSFVLPNGRSFSDSWELVPASVPAESTPTFSIVSGSLPPGLTLNASSGIISGTPTTAGTYEFTFRAANNYRSTPDLECSMTIYAGPYNLGAGAGGSVPAATWMFDLGKFVTEQKQVWFKRDGSITRPTLVNGEDIIFADSSRIVQKVTRNRVDSSGYWTSPILNRGDRQAECTLVRVILRYESAASTTLTVEASGDGGETWMSGQEPVVNLKATGGKINRIIQGFNVSGADLRFRIVLPDDALVRIHEWQADIITRGNKGDE